MPPAYVFDVMYEAIMSYSKAQELLNGAVEEVWAATFGRLRDYPREAHGELLIRGLLGHPSKWADTSQTPPRTWSLGLRTLYARQEGAPYYVTVPPDAFDIAAAAIVLADAIRTDLPDVVASVSCRLVASGLVSQASRVLDLPMIPGLDLREG